MNAEHRLAIVSLIARMAPSRQPKNAPTSLRSGRSKEASIALRASASESASRWIRRNALRLLRPTSRLRRTGAAAVTTGGYCCRIKSREAKDQRACRI
ncbi:MAG TPA: hypothetical protein VLF18_01880 [Tahibacter sp.]|uniref:hypothetical protein n=1 Tax=Tahibacter sp. TaxID=2056211 RepID=UPI002C479F70|nr:hypothetical protein [Tahibacter sp.]HSX58925.1 hypothetical protein [Tahibacter sp.]